MHGPGANNGGGQRGGERAHEKILKFRPQRGEGRTDPPGLPIVGNPALNLSCRILELLPNTGAGEKGFYHFLCTFVTHCVELPSPQYE